MNLQDFINRWNGKKLDFDGVYQNQCVDLIKQYFKELGLFIPHGNAIDYKNNAHDGVIWIDNTPSGVPAAGDVVVWGMKPYGHVGIFVEGDVKSFRSFDQNWPSAKGEPCAVVNHTYTNVLGWLRPPTQATANPCQAQLDEINSLKNSLRFSANELKDCQNKLTATEKALADTQRQLADKIAVKTELNRELEACNKVDEEYSERLKLCEQSLSDATKCSLNSFANKELVVELFRRFWRILDA